MLSKKDKELVKRAVIAIQKKGNLAEMRRIVKDLGETFSRVAREWGTRLAPGDLGLLREVEDPRGLSLDVMKYFAVDLVTYVLEYKSDRDKSEEVRFAERELKRLKGELVEEDDADSAGAAMARVVERAGRHDLAEIANAVSQLLK